MDSKIDSVQEKVNNIFNLIKDDWKEEEGVVTWNSWQWGAGDNPHEVSATNYHIFELLQSQIEPEYENALDLGCGYGRITPYLKQFADSVHGYDYNEDMVAKAREAYPDVNFETGKAQDMAYEDQKFDLIFSRSVLQHIEIEDLKDVREEINRITADGATFIIFEDINSEKEGAADGHYNVRDKKFYLDFFGKFKLDREGKRTRLPFDRHSRKNMLILRKVD